MLLDTFVVKVSTVVVAKHLILLFLRDLINEDLCHGSSLLYTLSLLIYYSFLRPFLAVILISYEVKHI